QIRHHALSWGAWRAWWRHRAAASPGVDVFLVSWRAAIVGMEQRWAAAASRVNQTATAADRCSRRMVPGGSRRDRSMGSGGRG
ncbi:unnamed protein product, partial [Ectocarpus sp. 12 AP-2014]